MDSDRTIPVAIVGGTGYTGAELLAILSDHDRFDVHAVTARNNVGVPITDVWPQLRSYADLRFISPDDPELARCELVFFATPHATAMHHVSALLDAGVRVVDLSADFRLRDASIWAAAYGEEHARPELLGAAVYGLPEMNREAIRQAQLVANPGCYPTATLLALMPAVAANWLTHDEIVVDAKSGVSGAGKKVSEAYLFGSVNENFLPYGGTGHRHLPEILQGLADTESSRKYALTFLPHLLPVFRGMEVSCYLNSDAALSEAIASYEDFYAAEPFVEVLPKDSVADTKSVAGSNYCRISILRPSGNHLVISAVIDNLVKGAAGQAIQNANLMFELEETTGLTRINGPT